MLGKLIRNSRWFASIGLRMYRAKPVATAMAIVFILVGQTARILSMLLPIKIVFLIGSGGMPEFFPKFLQRFESTDLILLLSICAGLCFVISAAMEQAVDKYVKHGAISILSRSRRITTIPREQDKLERLYYQSAKAIAELTFSLFALGVLYLLDLAFGLFATLVILVTGVALLYLAERSERLGSFREWSATSLPAQIQTSSSIAFFLCFTLILIQFLSEYPLNILGAVLCLLISRRLFQKLGTGITSVTALLANKGLADSLFFLRPYTPKQTLSTSVWSFLPGGSDWETVVKEIAHAFDGLLNIEATHWIQTGIPEVLALDIKGTVNDTKRFQVLVKIYGRHRRHLADQEHALASSHASYTNIGPHLLARTEVQGLTLLIFDFWEYKQVSRENIRSAKLSMSRKLLAQSVDRQIERRYSRSNTSLSDRLTEDSFSRLKLVCDQDQEVALDALASQMDNVICLVKSLPLQVATRSLNLRGMLYSSPDGNYRCIHWAGWSIEPIGFGWPVDHLEALQTEGTSSEKLKCIDTNVVMLVALLSELEYRISRELYSDALELVPTLLSVIDRMGLDTEHGKTITQY